MSTAGITRKAGPKKSRAGKVVPDASRALRWQEAIAAVDGIYARGELRLQSLRP